MRRCSGARAAALGDVGLYLVFAAFAGGSARWSQFADYRVWGSFAVFGYLVGLAQAMWLACRPGPAGNRLGRLLRDRTVPVLLVGVVGLVVPLVVLLVRRVRGLLWSEQPEVWVIERAATSLVHAGSPYTHLAGLGRPPVVADYNPYGPPMTVFGLPRALLGASPLTDARVMFAVVSVVVLGAAWLVAGRPRIPVRAAQLVVACPLTALAWSVAGDDLPVVALAVLALALAHRRRPAWCGAAIGLAVSMKLLAAPVLAVLAVAVAAGLGGRALVRFLVAAVGVAAGLTVPVLLVDPADVVEQVILFPLGLGRAHSPAASPLPGNLINRLGGAGHPAVLALLALTALAMAVWLLYRPPHTAAAAAVRAAVGLTGAILLAPATRFGYLVYPVVLCGTALVLRAAPVHRPETGPEIDSDVTTGSPTPPAGGAGRTARRLAARPG